MSRSTQNRPISLKKIILYLVFSFLLLFTAGLLVRLIPNSVIYPEITVMSIDIVNLFVIIWLFKLYQPKNFARININKFNPKFLVFYFSIILLALLVALVVPIFIDKSNITNASRQNFKEFMTSFSLLRYIILYLSAAIVGPIAEEIFFRGILFNYLKDKFGVIVGVLISSTFFALIHLNFNVMIKAFIVAVVCASIYYKTKNIWYSVAIHSLFNFMAAFITLFSYQLYR